MDTTVVLLLVIFIVLIIVGSLLPLRARRTRHRPSAREDANDQARGAREPSGDDAPRPGD